MSEVCGNEWQARIVTSSGRDNGGQGWSPLQFFTNTPSDCKKTPFFSIKVHLI